MNASIEISYYPLINTYIPHIQDFIDRLTSHANIKVSTNGMSTQAFGNYRDLMEIITNEIEKSFQLPSSIFVLKIINDKLDQYIPYHG